GACLAVQTRPLHVPDQHHRHGRGQVRFSADALRGTVIGDFNHRILDVTSHRPWPIPSSPWVMTQTWHDLLFAHWPVDAAVLGERIPAGFELDTFDGQAWVAV